MQLNNANGYSFPSPANDPIVSIITVVFNGEATIEKTIQSVAEQSYPNIEYIIIDGNSTDSTLSIIKKHELVISHWVSEKDDGIYDAMNKGIRQASGEIVHLLNADDIYAHKDVITQVVTQIGEYDYLSTTVNYLLPNRKVMLKMEKENLATIPHPGLFVKRHIYSERLFDLSYKYASDLDFIVNIKDGKKVKKEDILSVNMMAGGLGTSAACFREAKKIYLDNGYHMVYLLNLLKRKKASLQRMISSS